MISEIQELTVCMQDTQNSFVILAEILTKDSLIDAFLVDDVPGYRLRVILNDEPFGDVIRDCVCRFLVEHQDEMLCFLVILFIFTDVI